MMDTPIIRPPRTRMYLSAGIFAALTLVLMVVFLSSPNSAAKQQIHRVPVTSGQFIYTISAYGRLEPRSVRLVTAPTHARVASVSTVIGETVTSDTLLFQLIDEATTLRMREAELDLSSRLVDVSQFDLAFRKEVLEREMDLHAAEMDLTIAQKELEAFQVLAKSGTVSSIDLKRHALKVERLRRLADYARAMNDNIRDGHETQRELLLGRVEHSRSVLAAATALAESLHVRAGKSGILQDISVEIGQAVAPGDHLATVSNPDELSAMVVVTQTQAEQVSVGQSAVIHVGGRDLNAVVKRIEPAVRDHMVSVELSFQGADDIPIRAMQSITADIKIGTDEALSVENIGRWGRGERALVNVERGEQRLRSEIVFGEISGNRISVNSGALTGDILIIDGANAPTAERLR